MGGSKSQSLIPSNIYTMSAKTKAHRFIKPLHTMGLAEVASIVLSAVTLFLTTSTQDICFGIANFVMARTRVTSKT